MIGFNALGQLGRLGNQMFQYAALRGIASKHGYEICIPPPKREATIYTDHTLFHTFKMKNMNTLNLQYIDSNRPTLSCKFEFDQELFDTCPDWVNLQGYFQSEKYFKHIRESLLEDFTFRDEYLEPAEEYVSDLDDPISLHVRRTDYITNPNHSGLELNYYEKALKKFDDNRPVLIFSDDPEWCMNTELFDSDRFLVSETNSTQLDLAMMSLCKSHIIANSSFSWWGAWLSDSDKVVAPKDWFKNCNNSHLDVSDIVSEDWELV